MAAQGAHKVVALLVHALRGVGVCGWVEGSRFNGLAVREGDGERWGAWEVVGGASHLDMHTAFLLHAMHPPPFRLCPLLCRTSCQRSPSMPSMAGCCLR